MAIFDDVIDLNCYIKKLRSICKTERFLPPKKLPLLHFSPCLPCWWGKKGRNRFNAWCESSSVVGGVQAVST